MDRILVCAVKLGTPNQGAYPAQLQALLRADNGNGRGLRFCRQTARGPLITRDQLLSYNREVYSAGNSIQTECRTCKATFGLERWCWG
jgi:hypothetical protein